MSKKTNKEKFIEGRGLDIGTSFIIASRELQEDNKVQFTEFRDAYIKLKPSSPIAKKMMEKGLKGQQYFEDIDGGYIVLGQDAIERAIERNTSVERPLVKGVISPKQKQARRILRHIFKELLGEPQVPNEKLVYSIPAQPVDQDAEQFDVGFHEDALNNDLKELGYNASSCNEAEAICYSELDDDEYTGVAISMGSGMSNICLMSAGENIKSFSLSRSGGDYVDRMAAQATDNQDTVVQAEKENGGFIIGEEVPNNPILTAVSLYYVRLIDYVVQNLLHQLTNAKDLPKFTKPIPIVLAGGTSKAKGFIEQFKKSMDKHNKDDLELPFEIKEIRHAKDPLRSVSRGLLIASSL